MHQIRYSVPLSNGRFTSLHQVHGYPILPSSRLSSPGTIFEQISSSIGFLGFLSQLQQSEQLIENSKLPTAEANTNATSVIKAPSNRTLDIATVRNNRGSFSIGFLEYYCLINSDFTLRSWTQRLRISERHTISKVNSN